MNKELRARDRDRECNGRNTPRRVGECEAHGDVPCPQADPRAYYTVGQEVEVHAMGYWYEGVVIKLGRTRVTVSYTSGAGVTRSKACPLDLVRRRGAQGPRSTRRS